MKILRVMATPGRCLFEVTTNVFHNGLPCFKQFIANATFVIGHVEVDHVSMQFQFSFACKKISMLTK